jgi:hypothetical protein
MSKISCEIIKDLLPLYYDNVCSDESKTMVEEHLSDCNSCKHELDSLKAEIRISRETIQRNLNDGNVIKDIALFWKRSKVKAFCKGIISATIMCAIIISGYIGLFKWDIISVPTDVIKITDVSKLTQGSIAYHIEMTDGCELKREKYSMDKEGNFYITPLRPIIKMKDDFKDLRINNYDFFDVGRMEWLKAVLRLKHCIMERQRIIY